MNLREEMERLSPNYYLLRECGSGEWILRSAVLALLDQWELLIEGKLWEPKGGSRFDHPEALYIQTDNAALQPLIRLINQEFKPGDRIAIWKEASDETR